MSSATKEMAQNCCLAFMVFALIHVKVTFSIIVPVSFYKFSGWYSKVIKATKNLTHIIKNKIHFELHVI